MYIVICIIISLAEGLLHYDLASSLSFFVRSHQVSPSTWWSMKIFMSEFYGGWWNGLHPSLIYSLWPELFCKCQISLCFTLFLQNITRRFLLECLTGCCCFLIFKVLIWIFYAYMKLSVLSTWAFKKQHACYGKLTLKWYAGFGVAELSISQQDKFLFFAKLCKVLVEPYIVKTPC